MPKPSPKWRLTLRVWNIGARHAEHRISFEQTYDVRAQLARTAIARVLASWQRTYRRRIGPGTMIQVTGVHVVERR